VSELCDTIGRGDRTVDDVAGELFDATESELDERYCYDDIVIALKRFEMLADPDGAHRDRDEQIAGRNVHVTTVGGESDDDAEAERRPDRDSEPDPPSPRSPAGDPSSQLSAGHTVPRRVQQFAAQASAERLPVAEPLSLICLTHRRTLQRWPC